MLKSVISDKLDLKINCKLLYIYNRPVIQESDEIHDCMAPELILS